MRIAIIGAGVIGCATAWRLARQGADVTVFEQRAVGAGATQASAGALVPYVEAHEQGPLQDLAVRSLNLYDHFIEELREESRLPVEYERCGSLEVAFTDAQVAILKLVASRHAVDGVRWIGSAETLRLEPALAPGIRGSLLVPSHGYVSASQLTAALADAATTAAAVFRPGVVTGISPAASGAAIVTDNGAVEHFDRVVIATGAWARLLDLQRTSRLPVTPIRGQLLRLRGFPTKHLLWSHACYVVPRCNGEVLVGATMENVGFDERSSVAGIAELLTAAMGLLPSIAHAEFVEARVGLRPATADQLPLVGYSSGSDAILYATGHFRNGIVLTPLTARILADLILDNVADPALALMAPARFGF